MISMTVILVNRDLGASADGHSKSYGSDEFMSFSVRASVMPVIFAKIQE